MPIVTQTASFEKARQALREDPDDLQELLIGRRIEGDEHDFRGVVGVEHAVERQYVEVNIEIDRVAAALYERNRTGLRVTDHSA